MSAQLAADEFAAFFTAVHGCAPFPWQSRLAEQVLSSGWPAALDVPTGAGKTAAIDVAVFHLALEAARGTERRAPVRMLFVVDRRLVVDDAYCRAERIRERLERPETAPDEAQRDLLRRVAARLALLSEHEERPLAVARLRGGMPKEPDWVRTPSQPVVIVSTVDQVGSRLLFRGYGVSDSMKPVHAGLLGADALLLLDEAHLSGPFVETVRALRAFEERGPRCEALAPAPFAMVTLSATQSTAAPFRIGDADREHPVLGRRLNASKPALLVKVAADSTSQAFISEFIERAIAASSLGGGAAQVVAVVVNRVRRARAVREALEQALARRSVQGAGSPAAGAARVVLLIGRTRDIDREALLSDVLPAMRAGREARPGEPVLFVVATQCVEAGADLDFDALLTELAPLDALRQRFGRLNRMGRAIEAAAAILAARDQLGARAEDPLYGKAAGATWELLDGQAELKGKAKGGERVIDFGVEASRRWLPEGADLERCLAPRERAPLVLPAYVDLWTQTSPVPAVDPEPSLFLHGPRTGPADIELLFRADLLERDLREGAEHFGEQLRACPPSTLESIALPVSEVKRWLADEPAGDVADIEGREAGGEEPRDQRRGRLALRYLGADRQPLCVRPDSVVPGDVLVVPATYGGCDAYGWSPTSRDPVRDVAEEANRRQRGRDVLRLSLPLLSLALEEEQRTAGGTAERVESRTRRAQMLIASLVDAGDDEVLEELRESGALPAAWAAQLPAEGSRRRGGRPSVLRDGRGAPLAIVRQVRPASGSAVTEDDDSVRSAGVQVLLTAHSAHVEQRARAFAGRAGLPPALIEDIALAAFLHDAGKAHPAFKRWLYGGDELAARGPALAKSGQATLGARARDLAALPSGARHEAASVRFALAHPRLRQATDGDLVLWLVATHHGWGRPFFPAVEWPLRGEVFSADLGDGPVVSSDGPQVEDLGAGWPDLFVELKRRYGPWGLARLEAIMRLADHRQSEDEQQQEGS